MSKGSKGGNTGGDDSDNKLVHVTVRERGEVMGQMDSTIGPLHEG